MALREKANEYFSSLNSMANRICVDMKTIKSNYEDLWHTLTYEEQQQLLNQNIIKPEVSLKYPAVNKSEPVNKYAVKMIVDDNYAYRDEHSGPFCFRTTSQRDLSLFQKKTSPKPIVPKIIPPKAIASVILVHEKNIELQESLEIEDLDECDSTSLTHILPKTGLDLLDNW